MPAGWNAQPLTTPNIQGAVGPLSQEGVQMQWQLPQLPAQVVTVHVGMLVMLLVKHIHSFLTRSGVQKGDIGF